MQVGSMDGIPLIQNIGIVFKGDMMMKKGMEWINYQVSYFQTNPSTGESW